MPAVRWATEHVRRPHRSGNDSQTSCARRLLGIDRYFGLGLWQSIWGTFAVEGLLWVASIALYVRITYGRNRAGVFGFWGMIAVLTALWIASLGAAPPPNVFALAVVNSVVGTAVLAWAYWVNQQRPTRE